MKMNARIKKLRARIKRWEELLEKAADKGRFLAGNKKPGSLNK